MNINGGAMLKNNRFKNLILFIMFAFIISIYIFDRGITDFDELNNNVVSFKKGKYKLVFNKFVNKITSIISGKKKK